MLQTHYLVDNKSCSASVAERSENYTPLKNIYIKQSPWSFSGVYSRDYETRNISHPIDRVRSSMFLIRVYNNNKNKKSIQNIFFNAFFF